jgi:hypothetical protein
MRLAPATSVSTASSLLCRMSRPSASRSITSRPYRPTVSVMSTLTVCGIANFEYFSSVASMSDASCPAARAFQRPSRVIR